MKGNRWLRLTRWMNLPGGELNQLFALNRKLFKASLLKEAWTGCGITGIEGTMVRYLKKWMDQLRWQRLEPFRKLTSSHSCAEPH